MGYASLAGVRRQELLTLREHMCSSPVFGGVRVAQPLVLFVVFYLSSSCVLCVCCQCLWIVHSLLSLRLSLKVY